jgi:hypothetical protein
MTAPDDFLSAMQKVLGGKPLFLLAGAGDLVTEKLRELPEALNSLQSEYKDFPMKAAGAMIGQAFRANLKVGELYDELTRRGEEVVAKMRGEEVFDEEDEPFLREPFMPEPVHRTAAEPAAHAPAAPAKKTAAKKTAAKKTAAKKTAAKKTNGGAAAQRRPVEGP